MERQYSRRSPAVKRLMKEAQELSDPTEQCYAQPLEDNLFEWHFTVRGPPDSDFQGGVYHGRITLPPDYPMKPPSIMLLTPTGRFEVGTKICLSISGHHPETWQPSWSIRTVMLAIIGFMPTKGEGAIGSLDYTPEERKVLAKKSQEWVCPSCKKANKTILPKETSSEKSKEMQREAAKLASQISFKKEDDKKKPSENASGNPSTTAQPQGTATPGTTNPTMPPNPYAAGMPFQPGMFPGYPPNFMNMNQQIRPPNQTLANQNPASPPTATPETNQTPSNPSQGSPPGQSEPSVPAAGQLQSPQPQGAGGSQPGSPTTPEVRQRTTGAAAPSQMPQPRTDPQRNHRQNDNSGGQWALIVMVIITILMLFLLGRRLYITYEYKFQSGNL